MAKFIVYDNRQFIIEADSIEQASEKWVDMSFAESLKHEVEGGGWEIKELT